METKGSDELIKSLVADLVKVSYRAHTLLMVSQIPASYSKEASELMEVCESIYKEFVVEDVDEKDIKQD